MIEDILDCNQIDNFLIDDLLSDTDLNDIANEW
jgi:hypothetical protein